MRKIKTLCVFGTRPEATKMTPLVLSLNQCEQIDNTVCITAQHRELIDQVLTPFSIKPAYDLNIMKPGQSLSDVTCRVLKGLEEVIRETKPDILLVHGDTTTTFTASLAAFYAHIRVGHVEAGLRSHDKYKPFPEEINRKLTTVLSDLFFAPTGSSKENLLRENIPSSSIYVTGNTSVDFLRYTLQPDYVFHNDILNQIDFNRRVIVMTAHRRESWGEPLLNIDRAAARLANDFEDVTLVYAMHPNPEVTVPARKILSGLPRVILTDALDVFDLHNLMKRSYMILSDSGGLQDEAPALHKPMVIMREVTERPEGLQAGILTLAGIQEESIYQEAASLLTDAGRYNAMASARNPFGDGHACERIIQALLFSFGLRDEPPQAFEAFSNEVEA